MHTGGSPRQETLKELGGVGVAVVGRAQKAPLLWGAWGLLPTGLMDRAALEQPPEVLRTLWKHLKPAF